MEVSLLKVSLSSRVSEGNKRPVPDAPATFADRLEREVEAFLRLWRTRRGLAVILVIGLVCFAGYWATVSFRQHDRLVQLETDKTNLTTADNILQTENKSLRETVAPLLRQAAKEFPGEEINISLKKLLEKFDAIVPSRQPVKTGSATVEVTVKSDAVVNSHFMDSGGYIVFGEDGVAFLAMTAGDCFGRQLGNGTVTYRGVFALDAAATVIGKPLTVLKDADVAQVGFKPLPEKSIVLGGRAICTFNSAVRVEFAIPPQTMDADFITIPDVRQSIASALEQ